MAKKRTCKRSKTKPVTKRKSRSRSLDREDVVDVLTHTLYACDRATAISGKTFRGMWQNATRNDRRWLFFKMLDLDEQLFGDLTELVSTERKLDSAFEALTYASASVFDLLGPDLSEQVLEKLLANDDVRDGMFDDLEYTARAIAADDPRPEHVDAIERKLRELVAERAKSHRHL